MPPKIGRTFWLLLTTTSLVACQEEEPWTRVGLLYDHQPPKRQEVSFAGDWVSASGSVWVSNILDLKADSTFEYVSASCLGTIYSAGTWRKMNNVIVLNSYDRYARQKPAPAPPPNYAAFDEPIDVSVDEPAEELPVTADTATDAIPVHPAKWKMPGLTTAFVGTVKVVIPDVGSLQADTAYATFNNAIIVLQGDSLCPVNKQGALRGNYGRRHTPAMLPVKQYLLPLK